ncbi:MAG: deoxyribose-phosphate aldolase [Ilumatobacteraceae bacterium]
MSDDAAVARRAIPLVDLTDLSDDADEKGAERLCARGAAAGVAAVCVWPRFVPVAVAALEGTGVRVATVVNFPSGDEAAYDVGEDAHRAVTAGATEVDVVLPYRAWLAGDEEHAASVLENVRAVTNEDGRMMKVIIETGMLTDRAAIAGAAGFAIAHDADFVKTSTGKTPVSATPEAAETILNAIGEWQEHQRARGLFPRVGLKVSGGVRTVADAAAYLDLADRIMGDGWVTPQTFRFGASGLLDALQLAKRGGLRLVRPGDEY